MNANIGWQRFLAYLKFLDGTLLIRLIEPLELRLKRGVARKNSACATMRCASWLQEVIPLDASGLERQPHLRDLAGHIAKARQGISLNPSRV